MPPPGKKSNWWIGCLIAGAIGIFAVFFIGLLAAIAIPSFVKARHAAQEKLCENNVRQIEHVKAALALERDAKPGDTLPVEEVKEFLGQSEAGGRTMCCPKDPQKSFETSYEIGVVGEGAACRFHRSGPAVSTQRPLLPPPPPPPPDPSE